MTSRTLSNFWIWCAVAAAVGLCIAAVGGGLRGVDGYVIGLAGSGFNLCALWAVIRLMGSYIEAPRATRRGTTIVVFAFFIKLPVFIGLAYVAQHIGGAALGCFLLGVALVYFALVGWMLARR